MASTETAILHDDLATMILPCCNPELTPNARLCLTLKAACGFSVKEIARALGMQEEAIKKTLTRAKEKVAGDWHILQTLDPDRVALRFRLVLETIYALFNEGYAASGGVRQLRHYLSAEAIHLADSFLLSTLTPAACSGELHALRALMLLHFVRFQAHRCRRAAPAIARSGSQPMEWCHDSSRAGGASGFASSSAGVRLSSGSAPCRRACHQPSLCPNQLADHSCPLCPTAPA